MRAMNTRDQWPLGIVGNKWGTVTAGNYTKDTTDPDLDIGLIRLSTGAARTLTIPARYNKKGMVIQIGRLAPLTSLVANNSVIITPTGVNIEGAATVTGTQGFIFFDGTQWRYIGGYAL